MYILRDYQKEAVEKGLDFFRDKKQKKNSVIVLPTGSGKSLVIAKIAKELDGNVLIFQPSKELLEQNYQKFIDYEGEASIYSASKNSKEIGKVTFCTIGSVKNKSHLFRDVKYVISDECHKMSPNFDSMYKKFFNGMKVKLLGLTASPFRLKSYNFPERHSKLCMLDRTRPKIFQDYVYVNQIKDLYNEGYLCECKYKDISFDRSKLIVNSTKADYQLESMNKEVERQNVCDKIIEGCTRTTTRNHILIFVPSIQNAEYIRDNLDSCELVSGKTPKKEREKIINDFKSGKIRCVVNVNTMTIGFDFPSIDMIVIGRPTFSLALYMQIVGRGIRVCSSKKDCLIVDLVGNHKRFGDIKDIMMKKEKQWGIYSKEKLLTGVEMTNE